jgi:hypothetical protein
MKKISKVSAVVSITGIIALWLAWPEIYEYALLKALSIKAWEIVPNQEGVWGEGPETRATHATNRPPNIILILAYDHPGNIPIKEGGKVIYWTN